MNPEFLLAAFIVVLVPGTGVVYTLSIGLTRGRAMSVAAAFGCTLGILPALLASVFGLAAVLDSSAALFSALRYAGALYLFWLAWQSLRADGALRVEDASSKRAGAWQVARYGFLINILNPKLTVFFFALLPQFIDARTGNPTRQLLEMSAVFMAMTFAVFVVYGALAAQARRFIVESASFMRWLRRATALTFVGFGLRLATSDR